MLQRILNKIKSGGITPSFSIFVFKQKSVIFEDYFNCNENSIFDLASLTKPLLTYPLALKYCNLNEKITKYYDKFPKNLTLKNLITHNSGLIPWLPLYLYSENYVDTIIKYGFNKKQSLKKDYSCLNYIVLKNIIEKNAKMTFKKLSHNFLKNFQGCFIPPISSEKTMSTEFGNKFEYNLAKNFIASPDKSKFRLHSDIKGETHDLNAFYDNQISGNAGLFATTKGTCSLILNLLSINNFHLSLMSKDDYYYHLGFTGTGFAISKNSKVFVVFLSNRVYPEVKNIDYSSIRHEIFKEALKKYC